MECIDINKFVKYETSVGKQHSTQGGCIRDGLSVYRESLITDAIGCCWWDHLLPPFPETKSALVFLKLCV